MPNFKEILPTQLTQSPFSMIGDQWMLITAQSEGRQNTMTASWGGVGILWNKPVAFVFIRDSRYTFELVENTGRLSLNFLPEQYRAALTYCGKVSGRDEDKIAKSGFTVLQENDTPYFEQANTVFLCKKLYAQDLREKNFMSCVKEEILEKNYPKRDFHRMYVVEIEKILQK